MNNKLLAELVAEYESAVERYVEGYNEGEKKSRLKTLKSVAADAIKKYNDAMERETYREWAEGGNPVKVACRTLKIPDGVRVSYKVDDDTDKMSATFKDADIFVSLPMMQHVLGDGVFNCADWFQKCEKLAYMYAGHLAEILGMEKFKYPIQKISKEFNFPDDVNVYSEEGIIRGLQAVFDAILYIDPEATGTNLITARSKVVNGATVVPAWTYIKNCMSTYDKAGSCLRLCNTGNFSYIVLETMHKIMMHREFRFIADDPFAVLEECGSLNNPTDEAG